MALACFILTGECFAQSIAINTDGSQPSASAMLDIKNANKGLLIPRISLVSETDVSTIASPITSLLVFNNNGALPDGQGFYFWNGSKWSKLATTNTLTNFSWGTSGNAATDPLTNFVGTTDNKPLVFKTNNILSGKIEPASNGVFLGQKAGSANTGSNNSFFGNTAGQGNTSGDNNTAAGNSSLSLNTTGFQNTAIGSFALDSNTAGENNTAIGVSAMRSNTTKPNNTVIGVRAFFSQKGGFTGDNVAIGYEAAKDVANCISCTFIGANATTTGTSVVTEAAAIGEGAVSSGSFEMMFGSTNVSKWGFGRTSVSSFRAIEVGDDASSGNDAYLTSGGTWTNASSRLKKDDFTDLNAPDLLQQLKNLRIQKWKYKGTEEYHIGPVAEDFYKLFGLGTDDQGISTVDPSGIALAAIQQQQRMIEEQNSKIEQLSNDKNELMELIGKLQKRVDALEKK